MATEKTEKLDCSAIKPLLSAFADGETTAAETTRVKRHLALCGSCASELAFARALHSALFAAPREAPAPELFERIAAATYARPTLRERIAQWLTPAPTRWALGTALAAGLLLSVTLPRLVRESTTSVAGTENRESGVVASVPSPAPSSANVASVLKDNGESDKAVSRPDKVAVIPPPASTSVGSAEKIDSRLPVPADKIALSRPVTPVRIVGKENPATNAADTKGREANTVTKPSNTRVASLNPKPVKSMNAALPPARVSPPIAKSVTKSPATFVAEVKAPKTETPVTPVHSEPAPAPMRTAAIVEPDTRVAVKEPEPATARQVAMVEATRTTPGFSLRLKNAGVGRREISVPSPPNMRISDSASSFDGGRTRPLPVVGDNDNVASQK